MAVSARPRGRGTTAAVACVLVLALATGVAATAVDLMARDASTTYAVSTGLAVTAASGGILLLVAAGVLAVTRPGDVSGSLAACLSVAWFAPVLEGWGDGPDVVRTAGAVLTALVAPLIVHMSSLRWSTGTPGRASRPAVAVAYSTTVAVALGLAFVRDPFRDAECWRNCTANVFLVAHDQMVTDALTSTSLVTVLVLAATAVAGNVAALAAGSSASRRRAFPVLLPATVVAAALAFHAAALLINPTDGPHRPLLLWTYGAQGLGLTLLGAGIVATVVRDRAAVRAVGRLAELSRSTDGTASLAEALSGGLSDPTLRVLYPTADGRGLLDANGQRVDPPADPTGSTTITRNGVHVATVVHDRSLSLDDLEREIGPRARLAVENERLRATLLAEVATLRDSRARLVAAADDSRRRLERDLHDGAQQRLLALSYELRLAITKARAQGATDACPALEAALREVMAALDQLRDLAHGIFPAILDHAGLRASLETLGENSPVALSLVHPPEERFDPSAEMAAYLLVRQATEVAARTGADEVVACFGRPAGGLLIDVRVEPEGATTRLGIDDHQPVGDRVAAVGGTLTHAHGTVRAVIPCG